MTLARRIKHDVEPRRTETISWAADALTLVRSEPGTGDYNVVEKWSLEGP